MSKATLPQAISLLTRVQDKGVSAERLEAHFDAGLFSDLLEVDPKKVNRGEFRKIIGHPEVPDASGEQPKLEPTLIFIKQTLLGTTPVTVYGLGKRLTIAQMLCAGMKLAPNTSPDVIEGVIKESKRAVSPERADEMLNKQAKFFRKEEGGEDFGLRDDGWANLIPVEYPDGTVSVVHARWYGSGWDRFRYSLDDGYVWRVGRRLVLGNSDASNL